MNQTMNWQELQSRNAGIIRMCYDMHGENAGISAIFCEPDCRSTGIYEVFL